MINVQVFQYETVDSTNETAKRLIHEGAIRDSAYVLSREQTAGKGTRGRRWASPKNAGIYLSVIEIPAARMHETSGSGIELTSFTLAAGVACVECLRRLLGILVELKPINDLYAERAKLGGILTEAVIEQGRLTALITGIGINVRRAERLVEDARAPAISLEDLLDPSSLSQLDVSALASSIAADVRDLNLSVLNGNVDQIRWAWERYRVPDGEGLDAYQSRPVTAPRLGPC